MNKAKQYFETNKFSIMKTTILVLLSIIVIAGSVGIGALLARNAYKEDAETQNASVAAAETAAARNVQSASVLSADGGMLSVGNIESNGITLLSATAYSAEASATALSEASVTLKATVGPEDATNKILEWTVAFADPTSSWASGKTVTDYVKVTPSGDTLSATVECIAPFSAQIVVTVTSEANPDASASCTVDYAKKVTDVGLNVGTYEFQSGETLFVPFEVGTDVQGAGGTVDLGFSTSAAFTVDDSFTLTGCEVGNVMYEYLGGIVTIYGFHLENVISDGGELRFDRDFLYESGACFDGGGTIIQLNNLTTTDLEGFLMPIIDGGITFDITLTFTGTNSTYTYTTSLGFSEITNNSTVNSVTLDESGVLF